MSDSKFDLAALENAEVAAFVDFFRAAPAGIRSAYELDVQDVGTATCFTCRGLDPPAVFRRAARLGVVATTNEEELEKVMAHMDQRTPGYAVTASAHSRPAQLGSWLQKRRFTRAWAWMKFSRDCAVDREADPPGLEIVVAGASLRNDFGRVTVEAFGMPAAIAPWLGALAGRKNWISVMAFSKGVPVAVGTTYVSGEHAWLGFGATLPDYRRLGAQTALLKRRIAEAAKLGARVAVTETGERVPDRPSNSYRNILRVGFREMYLRQNYLSPLKTARVPDGP
jgi:GNAT superfamily N-acetyltransferase